MSIQGYAELVTELKQRITEARLRAALSVNRELVLLYWGIGRDILSRQANEGWGTKVIDRLAVDLGRAFPEMTGLSARNLKYMRAFAEAWPDLEFVQQVVALLPWGHNLRLLDAVKAAPERAWYARQAIENGWSRNVLIHQIESGLFKMMAIGLGKFAGAQRYHSYAYRLGLEHVIRSVGRQVLKSDKVLGGLAILEDAHHNIWISTNNGIGTYSRAMSAFMSFSVRDGLQGLAFNAGSAYRRADGELAFGGFHGLNLFRPAVIRHDMYVPPVLITGAAIGDAVDP